MGLDQKYLPRIVHSNDIWGYLSKESAKETGLKAGSRWYWGRAISRQAISAILTPGDMIFEASSYGEISCCVEEYWTDLVFFFQLP